MNGGLRMVLRLLLVFYFVAFVGFLVFSFTQFPPRYPQSFLWSYASTRALVLFTAAMMGTTAGAGLCAYSLFVRDVSVAFHQLIRSSVIFFLVLTGLYTVLVLGVVPGAERRLQRLESTSDYARRLLQQAEALAGAGDRARALEALDAYDRIDPESHDALELRERLESGSAETTSAAVEQEPRQERRNPGEQQLSSAALLGLAVEYLEARDYVSAHYYASLAYRADESSEEALRVMARAWREISAETALGEKPTAEELQAAELLRRKREAYDALRREDYVGAYYLFGRLHRDYPEDRETEQYLAVSLERARDVSFFVEDAVEALELPATHDILFVNSSDDAGFELIGAGAMVRSDSAVYFRDLEILRVQAPGTVTLHLTAALGKLLGSHINLNAIHSDGSADLGNVVFHVDPGADEELRLVVELQVDPAMLGYLRPDPDSFRSIPLPVLWNIRDDLGKAGIVTETARVAIVEALARPPVFLLLCLLGVGLGWRLRARYPGGTPPTAYAFVPLIPVAVGLASLVYLYGVRVLFGFIAVTAGLAVSLIALGAVHLVLLAVVLVMVAGQTTD